ncbi:MAG: hypothetical protein HYV28_00345 [Ignavibacteriales bacterium]|nr:hypothetical protein [Ignavibacteriales bacterium]
MIKSIKVFFVTLVCIVSLQGQTPFSASGSMGLSFVGNPDVHDYLVYITGSESQVSSFSSSLVLSVEGNYQVRTDIEASIQLDYMFSSNEYDIAGYGSRYKLNYTILKPSICLYKLFPGAGYQFRLGGGVGPRLLAMTETTPGFTNEVEYTKTGFGIFGAFDAATALSTEAFVYLNGNLAYDIIGAPEHDGAALKQPSTGGEISFNNFSAGVKIGILYKF